MLLPILLLAVVQGLTEFLPISSSGHLVLLQHGLGAHAGDIFLDIVLHVGTLGSVLVIYRRDVRRLLRFDVPAVQYLFALFLGTLPAVVAGLLLKDWFESLFSDPRSAGFALLLTGLILLSTRWPRGRESQALGEWYPVAPPLGRALLVGCAQALAIIPGVSRSGSTIAASLWLGLPRAEAARFSFLLSVPAIAGALVLNLLGGAAPEGTAWIPLLIGAGVAFAAGLVAIRLTRLAVIQRHFWKFAFYCLALGLIVLVVVD